MSWLSFIGNQPILSQWNESSREQDTDLYWKKLQLKNERDLLLYTAMLSDYSVFFFHKPSEVCMVFAAVAQPPSGIISDLLLYFWQLDAPTVLFFFFLTSLTAERVSPGVFPLAPGMCEVYTQWWVGRILLFLSTHHFLYNRLMKNRRTCVLISTARGQTLSDSVLSNQQ